MHDITLCVHMHLDGTFVPAGRLCCHEDGRHSYSDFAYFPEYVVHPCAVAVDPVSLPLSLTGSVRTREGERLWGGLEDACPDSWGKHILDTAARSFLSGYMLSQYDYLRYAGPDRIGALGFSTAPGIPPFTQYPDWARNIQGAELDLQGMLLASEHVEREDELPRKYARFLVRGSSVGGARPKATILHDGRPCIVKFGQKGEAWPTCRIEDATHHLAARCGLNVAETERISLPFHDRDIFLSYRFDRAEMNGSMHRIPFISARTLLAAREDAMPSYGDIARTMEQICPNRNALQEDRQELYRRMVFNAFCHNNDDHLRNHGFLYDSESGLWRLSPAYDIVPQPMMDDRPTLYLGIGKEGSLISKENLLSACADFGIEQDWAEHTVDSMAGHIVEHWEDIYRAAGVKISRMEELHRSYDLAFQVAQDEHSQSPLLHP